jgi:tartrate-resistant acid phosphatase type 5
VDSAHPGRPSRFRKRVWLCVFLVVLLVSGCAPGVGITHTPEQAVNNPGTRQAVSTTALTLETSHNQTRAPIVSETYTAQPSFSTPTFTITPQATATTKPKVVFAVIGDYGSGNQDEADVAKLIKSWQPDFIITLGDNNYPDGAADTMDTAVGQFFHSYIYPYTGNYGQGAEVNRFFPCLGNHDLLTDNGKPYFDYFTLPGNERYYDFTWGPVHLFALNTNDSEPDGVGASSKQADWLKKGLEASVSAWNIVYMHYPPYSSGTHGSTDWMRWLYAEWGADVVMAGHDHTYERLEEGGLTYFVNGLGGMGRYEFLHSVPGSLVRYNSDYGAMRVEATETQMKLEFITRMGDVVDSYVLRK